MQRCTQTYIRTSPSKGRTAEGRAWRNARNRAKAKAGAFPAFQQASSFMRGLTFQWFNSNGFICHTHALACFILAATFQAAKFRRPACRTPPAAWRSGCLFFGVLGCNLLFYRRNAFSHFTDISTGAVLKSRFRHCLHRPQGAQTIVDSRVWHHFGALGQTCAYGAPRWRVMLRCPHRVVQWGPWGHSLCCGHFSSLQMLAA